MRLASSVACLCLAALAPAQEVVNPDAALLQDFDQRIGGYLKLREAAKAKSGETKPTDSAEKIREYQGRLAAHLREARPNAKEGNIFTPETAAVFRRRIATAMRGEDGTHVRASLRRAAPVRLQGLRVNDLYPPGVPLQSVPPSLLLNLPTLPKGVAYGVVDHALILRDVDANIVIDILSNAIP